MTNTAGINGHTVHRGPNVTDVALVLTANPHYQRKSAYLTQAEHLWALDAWTVRWRLYWVQGGRSGFPGTQRRRNSGEANIDLAEGMMITNHDFRPQMLKGHGPQRP